MNNFVTTPTTDTLSPSPAPKINLLNYDQAALAAYLTTLDEKPFRATQLIKWIHQLKVTDFAGMTNISIKLRTYLQKHAIIAAPRITKHLVSRDGTQKWLLELEDNNLIETVFIPEKERGTLCISTQVGCAMGCVFCATGTLLGYKRNLTTAEIIGQVWLAESELKRCNPTKDRPITNIVIMGMGEPLLNFDNVVAAIALLRSDLAYGLSKYRITLSTVGLIPEIKKLSQVTDIALAISLHAVDEELRQKLIPVSKKYPLTELMRACKEFYRDPRRRVTIEYIMIDKVNDSPDDARKLVKLLARNNLNCKVNLIPCNAFVNPKKSQEEGAIILRPSSQERIDVFRNILMQAEVNTITRKTRGADIAAACGQLAAN